MPSRRLRPWIAALTLTLAVTLVPVLAGGIEKATQPQGDLMRRMMREADRYGRRDLGTPVAAAGDDLTLNDQRALQAKRIVTHDHYSFYNPAQLPFFDEADGRFIYFEGTYSQTFSGNDQPTPLYDYNQMLYRLDLAEPRLRFDGAH